MLTGVCQQLDLHDLVAAAGTCTRFRHGDGALETVELPTKSPVLRVFCEHAFPGDDQIPRTRPIGCSKSWVAFLFREARQRRCPGTTLPIAAGDECSLFVDGARRVLVCGQGSAAGRGSAGPYYNPTPTSAMAGVRVRGVASYCYHSLALTWDGQVYSWGNNASRQLGHGDTLSRSSPALVNGLQDVRGIATAFHSSLAVTHLGVVFSWGKAFHPGGQNQLLPIIVEWFDGVRMCRVSATTESVAFAIGEDGELFSWGTGSGGLLGHGGHATPARAQTHGGAARRSHE
jgi:hypothetical protein